MLVRLRPSEGLISKDENISDPDNMLTSLPFDSQDSLTSENLNTSNETKESNPYCNFDDEKAKAGSHQTDLNYEDIVYDRHDGKYTKKFDAEDDEVRFRKETELSGEVTVRPLRLTPIGREQGPTSADKNFQKYVNERNNSALSTGLSQGTIHNSEEEKSTIQILCSISKL